MNFNFDDELSPSDITTGSVRKKNTIVENTSEIIRLLITICLAKSVSSLHFVAVFIQDPWDTTAMANHKNLW
jgi:hypothetical protein